MNVPAKRTQIISLRALVIRADRGAIAAIIASIVLMPAQLVSVPGLPFVLVIGVLGVYSHYFRKPIDESRPLPRLGWVIGIGSLLWMTQTAIVVSWFTVVAATGKW